MTSKDIPIGANTIRIKKFNMNEMKKYCTIGIIAKRGSGKSFLTKDILFNKRLSDSAIAISRTEKLNKFYSHFIPESYIYSEYNPDILNKIFIRQEKLLNKNEARINLNKSIIEDESILIMDDCMSDSNVWKKDQKIQELFLNGRHYHISFILTMQYCIGIDPAMRGNLDYIFLFAEGIAANRKRLYDHYTGVFNSFTEFEQIFTELTNDYGVMVINQKSNSNNICDKVFWYKAKEIPDFVMGSDKYRDFHNKNYNINWQDKISLYDADTLIYNKKNNKIKVEKIS